MKKYKSIIFDCDGVILNSNEIKTESFRKVLSNFDWQSVQLRKFSAILIGNQNNYASFQQF